MSTVAMLKDQYGHCLGMLEDGIEKCPDDQWTKVLDDTFFVPVRIAFHVIQSIDYYVSIDSDGFDWKAFDFNWKEDAPEVLLDKPGTIEYLTQVKAKVASNLDLSDTALMGSDETFSPRFSSPLERLVYAARHAHHHIGQLSLDLQRRGLAEITW
jgi:hypothetical protein